MYFLIFGCIIFFATHYYAAFRTRDAVKDVRVKLGNYRYLAIFSLFTVIGFTFMVWGFDLARPAAILYTPPEWGRPVNRVAMYLALILLVSAYSPYGYIKHWIKNPTLLSIFLWSGGHLLTNGENNSIFLFGSFLIFALTDRVAVIGRPNMHETNLPSIAADIFVVFIGTTIYWLIVRYLHIWAIGVPAI